MKFILDENVSALIDKSVRSLGHEIIRFPQGTADKNLLTSARKERLAIITHDQDFAALSPSGTEGVLLVRIHPIWSEDVSRGIKGFLLKEPPISWNGKLVLIEKEGFVVIR